MNKSRPIILAAVLILACLPLPTVQAQGQGGAGRSDAPTMGPGNLVTGLWGSDPVSLDSRGWGWMTKAYVGAKYKRPFYNRAKEMLFSDKQVTSYTIGAFDPEFYCE